VAEELFVHKNTVTERIKRAEAILGHPVNENPVELEAALTLAGLLGQAVLEDAAVVVAT
jgi:DNA-binding PucR family transcriptional regulator